MKWGKAAIVNLDAHGVIVRACAAWKARYAIPERFCFSVPLEDGRLPAGFAPLKPGCLAFSDLHTKIIVVSHGLPGGIHLGPSRPPCNAGVVSDWFKTWGVRGVGSIAFKGCFLGSGAFLDQLAAMFTVRGMGVGWLIGYRNWSRTMQLGGTWHECIGQEDSDLRLRSDGRQKLPDGDRVKVVKGNRNLVPTNGYSPRYQIGGRSVRISDV